MTPIKDLDDLISRPPAEIREYVNVVEAYLKAGYNDDRLACLQYYGSRSPEERTRLDAGWSFDDMQAALDHRP